MTAIFSNRFGRHQSRPNAAGAPNDFVNASQPTHWLDTTPVQSKDRPCTVQSLEVNASVRGIYAEVTQTICIANPNPRPISTTLSIPLPDRAVVCGYALEIDGQMVDGVIVPKEQARVVFETEQRRGADPGLVEAVRGNVYSTRVYPVPARGTRRVRLAYVAPLLLGGGGSATISLPMPGDHLDQYSISIMVERLDAPQPVVSGLACSAVRLVAGSWCLETTGHDFTPEEPIRVEMPALPASFTLLERDGKGTTWFCASAEAPTHAAEETTPDYDTLVVLWDASGSRAGQRHENEIRLMHAYAAASVKHFTLIVFADHVREVLTFATAEELEQHIRNVRYDGGTDFSALARSEALLGRAREGITRGCACVLFTDGMDTLACGGFSLPSGCSVLTVVSGAERDAEALRQGCRGPVLDLDQAPQDATTFARMLTGASKFGMADIEVTGVADVCDVSASDGSRRAVIGRLTGTNAQLRMGKDDKWLTLRSNEAHEGNVLGKAWAARRITLLSPRADENADELLRLGRRFGMASPATSLLVLETLEQWLRYEIEPPRTFTRMHDAWKRMMRGRMRHSSEERRTSVHRAELARSWQEVMSWWEHDYTTLPSPTDTTSFVVLEDSMPLMTGEPTIGGFDFSPLSVDEGPSWFEEEALADSVAAAPTSAEHSPSRSIGARRGRMSALRRMVSAESAEPRSEASRNAAYEESASGDPTMQAANPSMRVSVGAWTPDAPYLQKLNEAEQRARSESANSVMEATREAYFSLRDQYRSSPSFFLDCASWFMTHDDVDFGVSVLTNLAELRIEDAGLLRVMGWRLREAGKLEAALIALRRVLRLRGEDSQSHRDLALVLDELAHEVFAQGDEDGAKAYAEEAGKWYRKVALTPWNRRPIAVALFAVEEYNVLRAWAEAQSWLSVPDLPSLGEDLEGVPDCDLRITLAWDADETDVDIHVTEPSGEEAYYGHRNTSSGGRVSEDITDGYGPELYEIRKAREGTYHIRAHYYASHQQTVFGPATCTLTVYSDWGRPNQTQRVTSTRLDHAHEMVPVGTASYGAAAQCATSEPQETRIERDAHLIELGMSVEQVEHVLGPHDHMEPGETYESRVWTLENGHQLAVLFRDGAVIRVMELMPWGEQEILLS